MDHGGIATDHHPLHLYVSVLCQFQGSFLKNLPDHDRQLILFSAVGGFDPADHIRPICPLPVKCGIDIRYFSCGKLYQLHGNGGGSNIHCDSIFPAFIRGKDILIFAIGLHKKSFLLVLFYQDGAVTFRICSAGKTVSGRKLLIGKKFKISFRFRHAAV